MDNSFPTRVKNEEYIFHHLLSGDWIFLFFSGLGARVANVFSSFVPRPELLLFCFHEPRFQGLEVL